MIPYETFLQAVHKIALAKPNQESQRLFTGKRPHISFKENPRDYRGLGDKNYGTGFETQYIPAFDTFFAVLDVDNYKNSEYDIMAAIPEEAMKTHTSKTQSGGFHLYFLSEEPLKLVQNINVPLDLKCIREDSYNNGKYGGLIVGDYCWKQKYDPLEGVYYVKKFYRHNDKPLLEIDFNNLVSVIYENLDLKVEKYKQHKHFKVYNTRKVGNKQLQLIYDELKPQFKAHLNDKYMFTYRMNLWTRRLTDKKRAVLVDWFLKDFGHLMEDKNKFKKEFMKRK